MNENTPVLPRRTAVAGTVAVCGLAAGCARYGGPNTPAPPGSDGGATTGGGQAASGEVLGVAADIPVGGGAVFKDQKIVVTQPTEGQFKGFSAVCTHQGCLVDAVKDGTIDCPCHGSKFAVEDGSVTAGPATEPLAAEEVSVDADGNVVRGAAADGAQTTEPPAQEQTTEVEPVAPGLASTADVPVGGGVVFAANEVVITQPVAGEFKAFSAVCTHQGCLVDAVKDGTINCPCHGSRFAITDGNPTAGPANSPLAAKTVTVDGDQLRVS